MNNTKTALFIGLPTYNGTLQIETADRLLRSPTLKGKFNIHVSQSCSSILAQAFNCLWCEALNMRNAGLITHFCMLHADIIPEEGWCDILFEEMERTKADVVSTVIPIKNILGLTSTAIGNPNDPWHVVKRLTMTEVDKLPMTFAAADCGYPTCPLLVNTGCWIADLSKPWCDQLCFNLLTRIVKIDGQFKCEASRSEDWDMSRFVFNNGGTCLATRKVKADHCGSVKFGNYGPWGTHDTDPESRPLESKTPYDTQPHLALAV